MQRPPRFTLSFAIPLSSMENRDWVHRYRLNVRGYELDSYRHVNHAVYLNYFEQARWDLLKVSGLSLAALDTLKRWPVVIRLEIQYKKPAFMDDMLEVRSRISRLGNTSFDVEHELVRIAPEGETLLTTANLTAAIVDETGRPARIPTEFLKLVGGEI